MPPGRRPARRTSPWCASFAVFASTFGLTSKEIIFATKNQKLKNLDFYIYLFLLLLLNK
jgi:hypothetical protein